MDSNLFEDNLRSIGGYNSEGTKNRSQLIRQVHGRAKREEELRIERAKAFRETLGDIREVASRLLTSLTYTAAAFSFGAFLGVSGLILNQNPNILKKSFEKFENPTPYVLSIVSDEIKMPTLPPIKEDISENLVGLEIKLRNLGEKVVEKAKSIIPLTDLDKNIMGNIETNSGLDAKIGQGVLEKQKNGYKYVLDVPNSKVGQEVLVRIKTPNKEDDEFFTTQVDKYGRATFNLPVNPKDYSGYVKLKNPNDSSNTIQSIANIPVKRVKNNNVVLNYSDYVHDEFNELYENSKVKLSKLENLLKGENIDNEDYWLWEHRLDKLENELPLYHTDIITTTYNLILSNKTIKKRIARGDEKIISRVDNIKKVLENSYNLDSKYSQIYKKKNKFKLFS